MMQYVFYYHCTTDTNSSSSWCLLTTSVTILNFSNSNISLYRVYLPGVEFLHFPNQIRRLYQYPSFKFHFSPLPLTFPVCNTASIIKCKWDRGPKYRVGKKINFRKTMLSWHIIDMCRKSTHSKNVKLF